VQGLIVNFAISYTIIGVLMGITGLYSLGFAYGGPVSVIWGWFTVGIFSMFIAASMAEICSSLPVSLQSMAVLPQFKTQGELHVRFRNNQGRFVHWPTDQFVQGNLPISKASGNSRSTILKLVWTVVNVYTEDTICFSFTFFGSSERKGIPPATGTLARRLLDLSFRVSHEDYLVHVD
jgi:hypothetical protein